MFFLCICGPYVFDTMIDDYVTLSIRDPTFNNLNLASTSSTEHTATSPCGAEPFFQILLDMWSHQCTVLQFKSVWHGAACQVGPQVYITEHLESDCWWLCRSFAANPFVVLPLDSTKHRAMGCRCSSLLHELHDVLWLRSCGWRSITMKPRHRALHLLGFHVRRHLLSEASLASNPAMTSCYVNEDFFRGIALLSRRV